MMRIKKRLHSPIRISTLLFFFSFLLFSADTTKAEEYNPIPDNPDARYGHSMVTLPDGRVVCFGGCGENDTLFNDLNIFRDTWTTVTPENDPPPARAFHNAWVQGEKMYVYGGMGATALLDDLWSYDADSNAWARYHPSGQIPESREKAASFSWQGDLYILGGQGETGKVSDVWHYNIAGNSWKKWGHFPVDAAGASAFVYLNQLFVLGNFNGLLATDLYTKIWREIQSTPAPGPRVHAAYFQNNSSGYLMGGEAGNVLKDTWALDMMKETWTQLDDPPIPLTAAAANLHDNEILLFGGIIQPGSVNGQGWVYRLPDKNCLSLGADLSIEIPCAEYAGTKYQFVLKYTSNPADPSGFYWEMDVSTFKESSGSACVIVGDDLSLPIPCLEYLGFQYEFTLNYSSGLFWKMDMGSFKKK